VTSDYLPVIVKLFDVYICCTVKRDVIALTPNFS